MCHEQNYCILSEIIGEFNICSNNAIGGIINWQISILYGKNPCLQYKWFDNGI